MCVGVCVHVYLGLRVCMCVQAVNSYLLVWVCVLVRVCEYMYVCWCVYARVLRVTCVYVCVRVRRQSIPIC